MKYLVQFHVMKRDLIWFWNVLISKKYFKKRSVGLFTDELVFFFSKSSVAFWSVQLISVFSNNIQPWRSSLSLMTSLKNQHKSKRTFWRRRNDLLVVFSGIQKPFQLQRVETKSGYGSHPCVHNRLLCFPWQRSQNQMLEFQTAKCKCSEYLF